MGQSASIGVVQVRRLEELTPEEKEQRDKYQQRRTFVSKELLETEKSYVSALKELCEWETELRKRFCQQPSPTKKTISDEDLNAIFSVAPKIMELHSEIILELEKRVENWHESQEIGDIFVSHASGLLLYKEYVNNYDTSLLTFKKCLPILSQSNTQMLNTSDNTRQLKSSSLELVIPSLLIQPIQRLPRYKLLLEDLAKHTWNSHNDYNSLQTSLEQVSQITQYINEQKKKHYSLERLLFIQNDIISHDTEKMKRINLMESGRIILDEGKMFLWKQTEEKTKEEKENTNEKLKREKSKKKEEKQLKREKSKETNREKSKKNDQKEEKKEKKEKTNESQNSDKTKSSDGLKKSTSKLPKLLKKPTLSIKSSHVEDKKKKAKNKSPFSEVEYCVTNDKLLIWKNQVYYYENIKDTTVTNITTTNQDPNDQPKAKISCTVNNNNVLISMEKVTLLNSWIKKFESIRDGETEVKTVTTTPQGDEQLLNMLSTGAAELRQASKNKHGLIITVIGHEQTKSSVVYHLEVNQRGQMKHTVKHRFNNFITQLHEHVGKQLKLMPPSKNSLESLYSSKSEAFLSKRELELQMYLDSLLSKEDLDITNEAFIEFFQLAK